jgi:hypothetical protein
MGCESDEGKPMKINDKVVFVIWNDERRAWLAAEGTGLFYSINPERVRQFPTQEDAEKWCKPNETVQKWIGG